MALWLHHFTKLMVLESAMERPRVGKEPDIRRYEIYQRRLNAIKTWLDTSFSVPIDMFPCIPCITYYQLFYVMGCHHQIATTRDASWNLGAAQESVNLIPTLDRIIHTFEHLNAATSLSEARIPRDEVLKFGVKQFHALKE